MHIVRGQDDPYRSAVEDMVVRMYAEEEAMGSLARLVQDGAAIWVKSVIAQPAALGRLIVAIADDEVVGFARGTTGMLPLHEGGVLVGTITHVFVPLEHRRKGIAKFLVSALGDWFKERRVLRTELNVVDGNTDGLEFWKAMGFTVVLQQMYKPS